MSIVLSKTTAYIGDTITISFNGSLYPWRSLFFTIGDPLNGGSEFFIDQYGRVQDEEVIFERNSIIQFRLSEDLYSAFNVRNNAMLARVIYKTYTGPNLDAIRQIGNSETVGITILAKDSDCKPILSYTIQDANNDTRALTGDDSVLIRYQSMALCSLQVRHPSVAPQRMYMTDATINGKRLTDTTSTEEDSSVCFSGNTLFPNVSETSFTFYAKNSMGFSTTEIVPAATIASPINVKAVRVIPYTPLTFTPTLSRPTSGENKVYTEFVGGMYTGSFGAQNNYITIQYRYREIAQTIQLWSETKTIDADYIVLGGSTYRSVEPVEIDGDFDYRKSYEVEFYVFDGSSDGTIKLTEVRTVAQVGAGVPVFDWGKNDFNINGSLKINHENIFDILYPIGSIYINSSSSFPTILEMVGTWDPVGGFATGMYAWERTG